MVWKLRKRGSRKKARGELRENHSGMETFWNSLEDVKEAYELRENHSGMETA